MSQFCVWWNWLQNVESAPKLYASQFMEDTVLVWGIPQTVQLSEKSQGPGSQNGGWDKRINIHGIHLRCTLSCGRRSWLRRKGDETWESVHAPRHENSIHVQTVRQFIYGTRWPEYSHSPIFWSTNGAPRDLLHGPVTLFEMASTTIVFNSQNNVKK